LKEKEQLFNNYQQHKADAAHQLAAMKAQVAELKDNEIVVVFDFKANMIIDQDPEYQISRDYYKNVQRTCLGAVVFYNKNNIVKKHYFEFFSDYLIHNSHFTIKALERLFESKLIKELNVQKVCFWMDNGPHFRTKSLFRYFFLLQDNKKLNISWNYFIEHHGKSCCDRRFSFISGIYKKYINNVNNPKVTTTQQLVQCITSMCQENNHNNKEYNNNIKKGVQRNLL
jgi:hypothetical protein